MRLKGVEATQRYIINEVLRIYAAQGQNIADKHFGNHCAPNVQPRSKLKIQVTACL